MALWTIGMGMSSSLAAAAIVYWLIERNTLHALIIGGTGVLVFTLTWFFTKKPPTPTPSVQQDVRQEVNPRISIPINISNTSPVAPAPAPVAAPDPPPQPKCNIVFTGVRLGGKMPDYKLLKQPNETIPYIAATFENKAAPGVEVDTPTVKARAIFRHSDGHEILDLTGVAWAYQEGQEYATLEANSPKYLALFSIEQGRLFSRSIEFLGVPIGSHKRGSRVQRHLIAEQIGSIEIQLSTPTKCLYIVVLNFQAGLPMPEFTGFQEL